MEIDIYEHGIPSWVDVSSPDLDAARAFYSALFGWDAPEGPAEAGGYTVATYRGRPVAGIGPQMNPGPPVWTTYVNVDDLDVIVETVPANGGHVLMAMDVMEVGRMGLFTDPVGAVFGVWQAKEHKGAGIVNESNTFCWNELMTSDVAGSKTFYGAVFGWDAETQGEGGPGAYTEWKLGGRSIGGMMAKPAQMPAGVPPHWGVYFAVADCDETVAKIKELGGSVMMGPSDIEPGRFAAVADPSGAAFNVLALKAELASE
jgi:uncharacterized protein